MHAQGTTIGHRNEAGRGDMKQAENKRGPKSHRILIFVFAFLLTILFFWLLGFIEKDIGTMPGPDYKEIEERHVDQALSDRLTALQESREEIEKEIADQREIQDILRNSTENSQQTMNQLLEMHRLNLERGIKPTEAEQHALAESESLFLENQREFQQANRKIAELSEQLREVKSDIQRLEEEREKYQEEARKEYRTLTQKHNIKVAALKLAFLIPLLLIATWILLEKRSGIYAPIIYAAFIATFWRTGVVMHAYFPMKFFKYIAIGAAIVIVIAVLVRLIRTVAKPKLDWLLKQRKEAYMRRNCPVCAYRIERTARERTSAARKGTTVFVPAPECETVPEEKPYVCPSCGTRLFERCSECNAVRPSLLPYCQECGSEKEIA